MRIRNVSNHEDWMHYHFSLIFKILGMSELVKERPNNPIEYLANYLIRNDPQRVGGTQNPTIQHIQQQNMMMNMNKN